MMASAPLAALVMSLPHHRFLGGIGDGWKSGLRPSSASGAWCEVVKAITKSPEPCSRKLPTRPRPMSARRPSLSSWR